MLKMTKKELSETLYGIMNQLDTLDKNELFYHVIDQLTTKQKKDILNYCIEEYPTDARISLEENSIIEDGEEITQ